MQVWVRVHFLKLLILGVFFEVATFGCIFVAKGQDCFARSTYAWDNVMIRIRGLL